MCCCCIMQRKCTSYIAIRELRLRLHIKLIEFTFSLWDHTLLVATPRGYSINVLTLALFQYAIEISFCRLFHFCNFCDILAEIWWPKRLCIMQLCPSAETWAGIISKWNKKIKFRSNASTLTLPLCTQKNLQHLKIGTYERILLLHSWIINAEKYALQVFMH